MPDGTIACDPVAGGSRAASQLHALWTGYRGDDVGAVRPGGPGAAVRRASLPLWFDRLVGQRQRGDLERTVAQLAAEFGLDPAEVRAELAHVAELVRRLGPCTTEEAIRRCAEEFGLPEAEVWAEYAWISGTAGGPA